MSSTSGTEPATIKDVADGARHHPRLLTSLADQTRPINDRQPEQLVDAGVSSSRAGVIQDYVTALMQVFVLFKLVVNNELVWSWLPLVVLVSFALVVAVNDLRGR